MTDYDVVPSAVNKCKREALHCRSSAFSIGQQQQPSVIEREANARNSATAYSTIPIT